MTDKLVTFETGTSGTALVTGGNYGRDAIDLVSTGGSSGTIALSNTRAMHGTQSARFTSTTGTDTALIRETGFSGNDMSICFYLWLDAFPATTTIVGGTRTSTAALAQVQVTSAGLVTFTDPGGVATTTATALSLTQWNRIEMYIEVGTTTSNGKMTAAVYRGDSTTPVDAAFSSTTRNMGTTAVAAAQVGKTTAAGSALSGYIDDFRVADGTTGLLGPTPSHSPPTITASAAQSNIDPWAAVTLGSTATTFDGATASTFTWTQTGGPTVPLSGSGSGRTFPAPGTLSGTTLTFTVRVTDSLGATSSASTTTVGVLAATERIMLGGSWVPAHITKVF